MRATNTSPAPVVQSAPPRTEHSATQSAPQQSSAVSSAPPAAAAKRKEQRKELHPWLLPALNTHGLEVGSTADKQFLEACPERIKASSKLGSSMFIRERVRVVPTAAPPPSKTTPTQYALQPHEWDRMMMLADDLGINMRESSAKRPAGIF